VTYEPGQQVLVRGVIQATEPVSARLKGTHLIEFSNSPSYGAWIAPADVVGPAPATPDDKPPGYCVPCGCPRWAPHSTDHDPQWVTGFFGEDGPAPATPDAEALRIDFRQGLLTVEEFDQMLAALAAAEAERDAAEKRIAAVFKLLSPLNDADRLGPYTVYMIRRALSVEATGTEGGGGHG
jgi:hypothetical protein